MPRFKCSYAIDIPQYFDFTVEAKDEDEAEEKIEKALKDGVFNNVTCDSFYENADNARVFVSEKAEDDDDGEPTLEELETKNKEAA